MKKQSKLFLQFIAAMMFLTGCGSKQVAQVLFQKRTPYEAYSHNLQEARLHQSALGKTWIEAGEKALHDSLLVKLPYRETGYFKAEKPTAASYTFQARQGEIIEVTVTTRARQDLKLFLDLFAISKGYPREIQHIESADTTGLSLRYNVEENLTYLVRLQPELLQSGSFTISIVAKPSLAFPVLGKDSRAVQSFWGAERDNGNRKHEGVDIFAAKGTPVLAGTKGIISRVAETPIGGKVVWLTAVNDRQNLYYAHLDQQLVQPGQQVNPGDTLGLVGNTGNARATPPHLHFGIYTFGYGAVDPFPFIYEASQKPAPLNVNEDQVGHWGRIAKNNALLRRSPESNAVTLLKLPKHTAVQIMAGTSSWYKIQLPDGVAGFMHKDNLESLSKPVVTEKLKADSEITEQPEKLAAPIASLKKNAQVAVLGFYQMFQLVKLADGTLGWLLKS